MLGYWSKTDLVGIQLPLQRFFSLLRGVEVIVVFGLIATFASGAEEAGNKVPSSGNLLYDIQNPFAYIPRVQIENHFDSGEGPFNASTYRLRMRPIIPVDFNDDWGLRTRSTINMTYQTAPTPLAAGQLGFGDMDLEFYFIPRRSLAKDMLLVGFGPSIHIPTATKSLIGIHQWGVGASAAIIWQPASIYALKGWTFAFNANQTFGFAPEVQVQSQNLVSFQPNVTYTTESEISLGMFSETYYNWTRNQWTVPVNAGVSFLVKPGGQNVVVTLIGRYFAERSAYDPQWGTQLNFNFLFPEGS
ncbi:MAG: hypothetical protein RLZ25_1299 [Pseudomonadota bacterium]|jgi:hypothetical protein